MQQRHEHCSTQRYVLVTPHKPQTIAIVIADFACAMNSKGSGLAVNINTSIKAGIAMADSE